MQIDRNGNRQGVVVTNSGEKITKDDVVRVPAKVHRWEPMAGKIVYQPGHPQHEKIVETMGEEVGVPDGTKTVTKEFPEL